MNGDVLSDGLHSYAWNSDTRPTTIDTVTVTYDALERMVEQNKGGVYTQIEYSPTGFQMNLLNGQTAIKAFVPMPGGTEEVWQSSGASPYYRHSDWLGSSRFSSTPSRAMYNDLAFAPFGEQYAQSGTTGVTNTSFGGNNGDTTTNLYDAQFREYGIQGRWPSPDPAGVAAANPANPQSWNRYAYAQNSPLNLVDPSGLACEVFALFLGNFQIPGTEHMHCSADSPEPQEGDSDTGGGGSSGRSGPGAPQAPPCVAGVGPLAPGQSYCAPQAPTQNCASHGFGFGVLGGGTAEGGVGVAGTGASGSGGAGVFYSGPNGPSAGGFIEGGSFANAGPHSVGAPAQTDGSLGLGGFAGAGGGLFITNAGSPQQLSGPFLTFSADIGVPFVGAISLQFSISSNNTFMLSGTFGEGGGIGGSAMTTSTKTTGGSCP